MTFVALNWCGVYEGLLLFQDFFLSVQGPLRKLVQGLMEGPVNIAAKENIPGAIKCSWQQWQWQWVNMLRSKMVVMVKKTWATKLRRTV